MNILYFALFLLASGFLFVPLNGLIRKMSYPLHLRFLHCRPLLVTLIALLAATNVYTISYPLQYLDKFINAPWLVPFLSFV